MSYKQGYLGTEDFCAPEHRAAPTGGKPGEICTTMTPGSWGYHHELAGKHLDAAQVWETLRAARKQGCNLLLNTAPLPDGSLHPGESAVLREVGGRLAREGFPGRRPTVTGSRR